MFTETKSSSLIALLVLPSQMMSRSAVLAQCNLLSTLTIMAGFDNLFSCYPIKTQFEGHVSIKNN